MSNQIGKSKRCLSACLHRAFHAAEGELSSTGSTFAFLPHFSEGQAASGTGDTADQ